MLCELCNERLIYSAWTDGMQVCRQCLRQLILTEARRKQSLGLAPLTDAEVAHLLFAKYLIAEGVITDECEEYEAAEL